MSAVYNTFNVYQGFNFRMIKNLFMVSVRFCEIHFILQVLLYTFKKISAYLMILCSLYCIDLD